MKKNGFVAFLRRKEYVIAGAFVVAAAVGTTVVYTNNQEKERQRLEQELAAEQQRQLAAAEQERQEQAAEASSIIPPKTAAGTANDVAKSRSEDRRTPETNTQKEEKSTVTRSTEKPVVTQQKTDPAAEPAETAGEAEAAEAAEMTGEAEAAETAETAASQPELHFAPEDGIAWPLEGNVILNYSMDATVHFVTLDQYKYNPAVIIEGEVNDKVCSVARGKVISIENNEVTGCTMTVDLGSGYRAIYGQLKEPNFVEGDYVEAGHVLGYVAEPTKYFSVEGSNLYFAMEKDGAPVDPMEFFE